MFCRKGMIKKKKGRYLRPFPLTKNSIYTALLRTVSFTYCYDAFLIDEGSFMDDSSEMSLNSSMSFTR